jgi:hypothetical protein
MKKILTLFNNYFSSFWFVFLLLIIGGFVVTYLNPVIPIASFYLDNLSNFFAVYWYFWLFFVLPVFIISLPFSLFIWVKGGTNSYLGFIALLLSLLSLGLSFFLNFRLVNLEYQARSAEAQFAIDYSKQIANQPVTSSSEKHILNLVAEDSVPNLKDKPAEVRSIFSENNKTFISLDVLSINDDFFPGTSDYFINESKKLRLFLIDDKTIFLACGEGVDGNFSTADVPGDINLTLTKIKNNIAAQDKPIYYFDVENGIVQTIYESCLP